MGSRAGRLAQAVAVGHNALQACTTTGAFVVVAGVVVGTIAAVRRLARLVRRAPSG